MRCTHSSRQRLAADLCTMQGKEGRRLVGFGRDFFYKGKKAKVTAGATESAFSISASPPRPPLRASGGASVSLGEKGVLSLQAHLRGREIQPPLHPCPNSICRACKKAVQPWERRAASLAHAQQPSRLPALHSLPHLTHVLPHFLLPSAISPGTPPSRCFSGKSSVQKVNSELRADRGPISGGSCWLLGFLQSMLGAEGLTRASFAVSWAVALLLYKFRTNSVGHRLERKSKTSTTSLD